MNRIRELFQKVSNLYLKNLKRGNSYDGKRRFGLKKKQNKKKNDLSFAVTHIAVFTTIELSDN